MATWINKTLKLFIVTCVVSTFYLTAQAQTSIPVDTVVETNPPREFTIPKPSFEGGDEKFLEFLRSKIKYPSKAKKDKLQGDVLVTFVVEKDGSLSDIKIKNGLSPELDAEALRVVALSPKWNPQNMGGRLVRALYTVSVPFSLKNK